MAKSKLGLEPAFACTYEIKISGENKLCYHEGMSKRFYAACAAMQGLCADPNIALDEKGIISATQLAYRCADELLSQERL
jgi:hypothetical protein